MNVLVVHQSAKRGFGVCRQYCGRPSPLGSPYVMASENERDLVCDWFAELFKKDYATKYRPLVIRIIRGAEAMRARTIELSCHCAPKRCHCETIAEAVRDELTKRP